jgi:beta-glucanase (GH16 family)
MKMMRIAGVTLIGIVAVLQSCKAPSKLAANAYQSEGYKLVWSDEFNRNGKPDTTNWRYEKGFTRNEELQWYQEENASCEKGMLVIEARKESKPNPNMRKAVVIGEGREKILNTRQRASIRRANIHGYTDVL